MYPRDSSVAVLEAVGRVLNSFILKSSVALVARVRASPTRWQWRDLIEIQSKSRIETPKVIEEKIKNKKNY